MPPSIDMHISTYSRAYKDAWLKKEDAQGRKSNSVIVAEACVLGPFYAFVEYFSKRISLVATREKNSLKNAYWIY